MPNKHNIAAINKITPVSCEAYLKNKGWAITGTFGNHAIIFGKETDGGQLVEVLVPKIIEIADYKSAIIRALNTLQDFENRSMEYIANDVVLSGYDIFRIIAFKGDVSASIPLNDAATLLNKSLTMIASAAQSINTQQPYYQSRRTSEVNNFLSKLRMGHTERGSFVLTIQTPIAPEFSLIPTDEQNVIADEPFERQATIKLCSLISEATSLANSLDGETLTQSISRGMSANFFEALADITDICGETGANLDMTWASVRPIQRRWNIKNSFIIGKEIAATFREAGKTLREKVPNSNVEVVGYVTDLHRDGDEAGNIKLCDVSTNPMRFISIELNRNDYEQAIQAHKDYAILAIKGNLTKNARKWILTNVSELKVIDIENHDVD